MCSYCYYFYADDTQLYISFKDCDVDVARLLVENCVADICHWMDLNELNNQSRQDRNYAYLLEVSYSSPFQLLQYGLSERLTTTDNAKVWDQYLMTTCYSTCASQTFADHRFTSLGTYTELIKDYKISHTEVLRNNCCACFYNI